MDERLIKKVERHYAHFHRVLSGLLAELAEQPGTTWLFDEGHLFAEHYTDNRYHKALYPVQHLGPFKARLEELRGVQAEAVQILGVKKVPHGLLTPQVLDGVQFVRLMRHENYNLKRLAKAEVLGRYQGKLQNALAAFEAFRQGSWGAHDPGLKDVEAEVRALEHGLARIDACDDEAFREHYRFERVPASVYRAHHPMKQYHVRDVGLILVGDDVRVAWADGVRQRRSDRVELEPLLACGPLEVYSSRAWDEAAMLVRG